MFEPISLYAVSATIVLLRQRAARDWWLANRNAYPGRGQGTCFARVGQVELPIEVVNNIAACEKSISRVLATESLVGFDSEWRPAFRNPNGVPGTASVVQIACKDRVVVVQVHKCLKPNHSLPDALVDLLTTTTCTKVGLGITGDTKKISKDYGVACRNFLEVRSMLPLQQKKHQLSLVNMCKAVLCAELAKDKAITISDWERDTLTQGQLEYAGADALAVLELYQRLSCADPTQLAAMAVRGKELLQSKALSSSTSKRVPKSQRASHAVDAERLAHKQHRFKIYSEAASLKRDLYENIELQAPDGKALSMIPRKKMNWYLRKGLAEKVDQSENPKALLAVRLLFEPTGRAESGQDDYYMAVKENKCVTCGTKAHLQRHYIVPYAIRRWFPVEFKSHTSHDVVLLCTKCRLMANLGVDKMRTQLAIQIFGPEEGPRALKKSAVVIDVKKSAVRKAASALLQARAKMPTERQQQLEAKLREFDSSLGEEITEDRLTEFSNMDIMSPVEGHVPVEQEMVEKLLAPCQGDLNCIHDTIRKLVIEWRHAFLEFSRPRFLHKNWDVNHRVHSNSKKFG